jgi:hypothetical protein
LEFGSSGVWFVIEGQISYERKRRIEQTAVASIFAYIFLILGR